MADYRIFGNELGETDAYIDVSMVGLDASSAEVELEEGKDDGTGRTWTIGVERLGRLLDSKLADERTKYGANEWKALDAIETNADMTMKDTRKAAEHMFKAAITAENA